MKNVYSLTMNLKLFNIATDFREIESVWKRLNANSQHSFFLSWGWVENWITALPKNSPVTCVVFFENDVPTIAFFLGQSQLTRKKIFTSRGLFLNATGNAIYDELCVEYNAVLHSAVEYMSLKEFIDHLPYDWDEVYLPGLDTASFPGSCLNQSIHPYKLIIDVDAPSPYVDLQLVRDQQGDYISLLRRRTKAHVRHSYRVYESQGGVKLEVATDLTSCFDIFETMVDLHQRSWVARGRTGAFASNFMLHFHRELIRKRFEYGEIQLLRISAGEETIGCIYNFVYHKKVYVYQLGINYGANKRLHPGLISHAEAIKYNARIGNIEYDFLAGPEEYKLSMSTNTRSMIQAKIQKPHIKFWVENRARSAKQIAKKILSAAQNRGTNRSINEG